MRERVSERIRDAILHGAMPLGQRIVEREMARQLGVSLTVVREALIQLEAEGFISKQANAATRVVSLSVEDVRKIFAVRRVLEGYCVEEACRRVTGEQARPLEETYLEILDAARSGDPVQFIRSDLRWHRALWELGGNEYLSAALERAVLPLFAFATVRVRSASQFELLADAQGHLPVLEAIKRRDPAAARAALEAALDGWQGLTRHWAFEQLGNTEGAGG